jgi:hypothetical protein
VSLSRQARKRRRFLAEISINSQLVEQCGQQNTFFALNTAVDTEMEMYKLRVQTLQIVKDDDVLKKETMEDTKCFVGWRWQWQRTTWTCLPDPASARNLIQRLQIIWQK